MEPFQSCIHAFGNGWYLVLGLQLFFSSWFKSLANTHSSRQCTPKCPHTPTQEAAPQTSGFWGFCHTDAVFNCTVGTWNSRAPESSRSQWKFWGTFSFWVPHVVLFWQIIYFSPGKIAGFCVCAEAAVMPTLQNTGHLKKSSGEEKCSCGRYGLFLILFIKAAIMPAEEWSTHGSFGRFPERKAVSPVFNLEIRFLTIPSWLIIAGDKQAAQTSSV